MKTIKTTLYSLTILLTILISPLYAAYGKPAGKITPSAPESGIDLSKYTFRVPMEADFIDSDPEMAVHAVNLKPEVPAKATFEDAEEVYHRSTPESLLKSLAPVTPREATFGDLYDEIPQLLKELAPVPPQEASFDETF
ncbi:MAG TPA: hypothetical protein VMC08_07645 [Bacteroidales bacterium]|nr:hypothetical protein [Bacteroidales bacterium]